MQSCKFIHGQYFCDNFILHCDVIRFTGVGIIVVRPPPPPPGEVRILCRTAARAHFVVIKKGAGQSYLRSDAR